MNINMKYSEMISEIPIEDEVLLMSPKGIFAKRGWGTKIPQHTTIVMRDGSCRHYS
jgi:hypothetical protein